MTECLLGASASEARAAGICPGIPWWAVTKPGREGGGALDVTGNHAQAELMSSCPGGDVQVVTVELGGAVNESLCSRGVGPAQWPGTVVSRYVTRLRNAAGSRPAESWRLPWAWPLLAPSGPQHAFLPGLLDLAAPAWATPRPLVPSSRWPLCDLPPTAATKMVPCF